MPKKGEAFLAVSFLFEKGTPGTYRFQESGAKDGHKIGTLYIRKSVFAGTVPKGLKVTVEVVK